MKLFLALTLFALSTQGMAISQSYCFGEDVTLDQVKVELEPFLLSSDRIELDREKNCVSVDVSPERNVLFQRALGKKFRFKTRSLIENRNEEGVLRSCKMKLTQETSENESRSEVKVGYRFKISEGSQKKLENQTSELLIGFGKTGHIRVDGEFVAITCQMVGKDFVGIDISLVGTQNSSLATTLNLRKGEKREIGAIVKDLNEKNKQVGTAGVDYSKTEGNSQSRYLLEIQ